jgi:nucleoid-associated protein YgaU
LSLKLVADTQLKLEKESAAKARRLASSLNYNMLTKLARKGIEKNDSDNDPDLVPTKYLFLWGMGMKDDSSEDIKNAVKIFQDTLVILGYLKCTYECWINRNSQAKGLDHAGRNLIGIYEEERDAEAEKDGGEVWGSEGNWKCWIRGKGAKRAWLSKGGIKGVYKSKYLAEKAAEDGNFLVRGFDSGEKYGVFGEKTLTAFLRWLSNYSKRNPLKEEPSETSYQIQSGDNLADIAERFGFEEWYDLYDFNKDAIENPDLINEGQVINFPKKGKDILSDEAADSREYFVERSYICPFSRFSATLCDFEGKPVEIEADTPYEIVTEDGELLAHGKMNQADALSIYMPKSLNLFVLVDGLRYGFTS